METQRFNIYSCEEFLFEGSYSDGILFLHVEAYKWGPSVLKKMYRIFGNFLNQCKVEGVKKFYTITPNNRFARLFNGISIGKITEDKKEYEVFVWDLKQDC